MDDFEKSLSMAEKENVPHGTVAPTVTKEDLELDEMLQARTAPVVDSGPDQPLKKEVSRRATLRSYVEDYKPAATLLELEDQIHQAKMNDIDSIEASPALVRHIWKKDFEHIRTQTGYGIYKDIRVYIEGFFEQNKDADKITMEQKLFGNSKGDIAPIITPQKI